MMNVLIGTIWQTSLVALPMFIVFHEFVYAIITGIICVVLSIVLKKTWWDNLHEMDKDYIPNTETD
jgi:hypothetical protein